MIPLVPSVRDWSGLSKLDLAQEQSKRHGCQGIGCGLICQRDSQSFNGFGFGLFALPTTAVDDQGERRRPSSSKKRPLRYPNFEAIILATIRMTG